MGAAELVIGLVGLCFLLLFLALGVPIAISLAVVGVLGCIVLIGFSKTLGLITTSPYAATVAYHYSVLPMFILMGEFAFRSGIAGEIYTSVAKWLGRIPGGLAMATTGGCAGFGAITGSSIATAATFAKFALPEMRQRGYSNRLAAGAVAASGSLAALIPPSAVMVLFCIFTGTSLGRLLIAGIIPGIVSAIIFMLGIYLLVHINPKLGPPSLEIISWREKLIALRWLLPVVLIFGVMLGGIYLGVFTPTEAGAVGVLLTMVIALVRRSLGKTMLKESLLSAMKTTAMIFFIMLGAFFFAKFVVLAGISAAALDLVSNIAIPSIAVVIIILFMYLILGTFLEVVSMLAITLPIYFPVVVDLGFDPIWFGILVVKMVEVAVITPPVGLNVYVVKGAVGEDISLEDIFRGIFPFLLFDVVILAILITFPQISLFLPGKMFGLVL